jgi:hypothetical protein
MIGASKVSAIVAGNPVIGKMRSEHAAGLRAPMVGIPMTGDLGIDDRGKDLGSRLSKRQDCQYAAAIAEREGLITGDISKLDVEFVPLATVVFVCADASQAEVARITIPDRVMEFDSMATPLALLPAEGEE